MSTGLSRSWDVLEWFIVACLCIVCICLWILVWKVWKSLQKEFSTYDPVVQEPPDGRKDKPIPPSPRERFMTDPIAPKRPDGGEYGWISPFIKEVRKYLNLTAHQNPSEDHTILPMILEKAALGIIEEGKQLGELDEAKKMAKLLMTQRNRGMTDVWKCCAHLYSMENFLHKLLNNSMRGIGDDETEHIWRSKIGTLGPFCFLLWDCPFKNRLTKKIVIYRGAKLETEQIDTYKKMSEHLHEYRSFQAFTSCSRNRNQAERFGNVLFIMEIQRAFTVDMKDFSEFPEEEEELITPGVCFSVQKIGFDKDKNKDLIYLTLTQRFNQKDKAELNKATCQQTTSEANEGTMTKTALTALGNLLGLGGQGFVEHDLDILIDILRAGTDRIRADIGRGDSDAPVPGVLGHRAALFLNLLADAASAVNGHSIASGLRALATADANSLPFIAGLLAANLDIDDKLFDGVEDALNLSLYSRNAINSFNRLAGGADANAANDLADALNRLVDIVLHDVDDNIDPNADFNRDGVYLSGDD